MWKRLLGFLMVLLGACQVAPPAVQYPQIPSVHTTAQAVVRAITDSRYSYSTDQTELVVTVTHDTGESFEYSVIRRPIDGISVVAQTTIRRNGAIVSSSRTTPTEAQFVLKIAANNGWQEVYRDLKARYRLIGLVN